MAWTAKIKRINRIADQAVDVDVEFSDGTKTIEDTINGRLGFNANRLEELCRYKIKQLENVQSVEDKYSVNDIVNIDLDQERLDVGQFERLVNSFRRDKELVDLGILESIPNETIRKNAIKALRLKLNG